jgi:hypothetical protein
MIAGRAWPQLGGSENGLDIIGINFSYNNQWLHGRSPVAYDDKSAWPLRNFLADVYARYGRPTLIAETSIEGDMRAAWFDYIIAEVQAAQELGVPVQRVCWYPILDHPGWDDRYCPNGLIQSALTTDRRDLYLPLACRIKNFKLTL